MAIEMGDIVFVGLRYVPASQPPYEGGGVFRPDEWTGRLFKVVGFNGPNALLLPADGPTKGREVASIHRNRLIRKVL